MIGFKDILEIKTKRLFLGGTEVTALYYDLQPTHILCVDNARTDDYTPDGSVIKPFKNVQDAHDAITGTPSITNTYGIAVALGLPYTGTLNISKDYLTIYGMGTSKGAGFKGTINVTSKHLCLQGVHLVGTSSATRDCYINLSQVGDFLLEIKDCRLSYCTLAVAATGTTTQKQNSYLQVTGSNSLWQQNTITCTGILGTLALVSGIHAVNTLTATGCNLVFGCATVDTNTVNLETGTAAEFMALNAARNTINLKTGATLSADITSLANLSNTLNNTGGTLVRVSDVQVLAAIAAMASSATGDLYYLNSSGAFTRLPIGTTGQVLKVVDGLPAWATA